MAITSFQLVNDQTFLPADVSAGVIFTSPEQVNGVGNDFSTGLLVVIDYQDLQSFPTGAALQAVVEGKSEQGQFYTIAYQFQDFSAVGTPQKRQIVMLQDLEVDIQAADRTVFVGGKITDHISKQQGIMPAIWRVRVVINDPPSSFISVRMSIYGQRFNQLTIADNFRGILVDTDGPGTLVTTEVV